MTFDIYNLQHYAIDLSKMRSRSVHLGRCSFPAFTLALSLFLSVSCSVSDYRSSLDSSGGTGAVPVFLLPVLER